MNVGDRIAKLRKDHGYTRVEFADKIGIPYTTLRNYETNAREPGHSFLIQMANEFNVSTDYLLGLSNDPSSSNKEKPGTAEAVPGKKLSVEERVQFLADFFEKMGFIEPGGDISESDLEFSKAIIDLIAAHFKK